MPIPGRSLLCCLTAALSLGGRRAGAQDHQAALLTTERLTADLSRDSGFTTALLRNAHPSAVLLWPGAPVTAGIADIGRLLTAIDSDSLLLTWQPLQVELAQDSTLGATWGVAVAAMDGPASWRWHPVAAGSSRGGDMGWTTGQAVIAPRGSEPSYSKYLTVWRRFPDGAIRFLTDGGKKRPRDP